jgi:hypothetical protein
MKQSKEETLSMLLSRITELKDALKNRSSDRYYLLESTMNLNVKILKELYNEQEVAEWMRSSLI